MEENLPPGFRFHPTDEELITYYLTPKLSNASFTSKTIADVDLNKCEPWDLPGMHLLHTGWFFTFWGLLKSSSDHMIFVNLFV